MIRTTLLILGLLAFAQATPPPSKPCIGLRLSCALLELSHPQPLVSNQTIVEGWHAFVTPDEGLDVHQTFANLDSIVAVAAFEPHSKRWAVLSHERSIIEDLNATLLLDQLEPHTLFYLLANTKTHIPALHTQRMIGRCQDYATKSDYALLIASGLESNGSTDTDTNTTLHSRYGSEIEIGRYSDSRVALIYPKTIKTQGKLRQYGPAEPKSLILFDKAYEERPFYMYDFHKHACYEGHFPSMRIPPFAILKELR